MIKTLLVESCRENNNKCHQSTGNRSLKHPNKRHERKAEYAITSETKDSDNSLEHIGLRKRREREALSRLELFKPWWSCSV